MLDIYLNDYNARLFPLRKRTKIGDANCKRPLMEDWPNAAFSPAQLKKFAADGHGIGWALGDNDLVIDIDAASADRPDKRGVESFAKLEQLCPGISGAAVVVTSPTGGQHLYFTKPAGKIRKAIKDLPGIDFLSKGSYVVIAGSPHWQGDLYKVGSFTDLYGFDRPEAPQALLALLARSADEIDSDEEDTVITPQQLEQLLGELDATEYNNHDDWFRVLAASHSATGGSREGMCVFVEWSTKDPLYADAAEAIESRWVSLKPKQGGITIGTLFQELSRWGRRDVVTRIRAQLDFDPVPETAGPTTVLYSFDEKRTNDQIIAALGKAPNLFQRAGALVSVAGCHINQLSPVNLCETISSVCTLVNENAEGRVTPVRIPERVGKQIVGRGHWFGIPTLKGIVTTPVYTQHGVLQTPGYDIKSGVYYLQTIDVPQVPERPSQADASKALARLKELVVDFPFLNDAHRSNWLAALLTLVGRHAIDGPVPLFMVNGNQAGIGKSLLVNLASTIAYGTNANNGPLSDDNEEVSKLLLSISMQGYGAYCFDNLKNGADFGCPALDAVLTGRSVSGRILGQSRVVDAELDTVFFATGNRVSISKESDSFRRVAIISLQSKSEDPKSRTDFKFGCDSALLNYALNHRAELLFDCLTVLQASKHAELPAVKGWGSYSAFSNVIRRALVWLGEPDPMNSRDDVHMNNEDEEELNSVITGILTVVGQSNYLSVSDLQVALRQGADTGFEEAKAALEVLAPDSFREPVRAMAKRLKTRFRDRPSGGFWIQSKMDSHRKTLVYGVEAI
jgi:hypothetical protein